MGHEAQRQLRIIDSDRRVIAQYGARWRIEGIVAEDTRFTAQRRGLNGRGSGPLLRATDVGHLSRLLAGADVSVRNSTAG